MKRLFMKFVRYIRNYVFAVLRIKTIGVRAIIINPHNQILLVRHTYMNGWYLPGGTLEHGETPQAGIKREIFEETGIKNIFDLSVLAVYCNHHEGRPDYPILFIIKVADQIININDPAEIAEADWFEFDNLSSEITTGTRARIREYFNQQAITGHW